MKEQKKEALSSANRYFFGLKYSRDAESDDELLMYYIENGGASGFSERELLRSFDPSI